jgi:hypothetical protein
MAYDEYLADRIKHIFKSKGIPVEGRKFMGGYCFFMDDKMCIGLDINKNTNEDRLMARIGENAAKSALQRVSCSPMDITGRPMKDFVFVSPDGFDLEEDLEYWVQLGIDYNPIAKKSKKKKNK